VKTLRVPLAIPAAFFAAAIVMRVLLLHAPPHIARDLEQPIVVVTNWGAFGAAQLLVFIVALTLATLAYLRIVAAPDRAQAAGLSSRYAIVGVAALALLGAWCLPVIFSSDVYAYAAYGELARRGSDPYAHELLARGDTLFDAAIVQWGNPPPTCVYGPLFVAIAGAIVALAAPFGTLVQLNGLRALSSGALLVCAVLAYAAYPGNRAQRLTAAATIGLNPVTIWCAAEGHNDALAVSLVFAGFALAQGGLFAIGAAIVAFSGSIKLPGIAAAVPLALSNRRAWIGAAVGTIATIAVSTPLLASVSTRLAPHARYAPQASFQAVINPLAALIAPNDFAAAATTWAIAAVAASAIVAMALPMLRSRRAEGWTYLALAGWLLVPNPYPWYALWLLAVAALAPGTRGSTALLWLTLASLLRYVPDAVGTPAAALSVALGVAATLPFLVLLRRSVPSAIINGSS
jgi:alpha-1,6-mannosyltransferase